MMRGANMELPISHMPGHCSWCVRCQRQGTPQSGPTLWTGLLPNAVSELGAKTSTFFQIKSAP